MLDQSKGKMFLSAERGHTESGWFRSYNTFNFGNYRHEHKAAFGTLCVFNDDTLAGGRHIKLLVEESATILVLPTVGAVLYKDDRGNEQYIKAGQAQVFVTPAGTAIEFHNPFDGDLINFLHAWIKTPASGSQHSSLTVFDLENGKNSLIEIQTGNGEQPCFIGKFTGRQEMVYSTSRPDNGLFVFVLEGAFEVQYRLLETRDALALWNTAQAELEALSNDAIVLLLEVPLSDLKSKG